MTACNALDAKLRDARRVALARPQHSVGPMPNLNQSPTRLVKSEAEYSHQPRQLITHVDARRWLLMIISLAIIVSVYVRLSAMLSHAALDFYHMK